MEEKHDGINVGADIVVIGGEEEVSIPTHSPTHPPI